MLLNTEQFVDLDDGDSLLHMDIRSHNVCFVGDQVKFIDMSGLLIRISDQLYFCKSYSFFLDRFQSLIPLTGDTIGQER